MTLTANLQAKNSDPAPYRKPVYPLAVSPAEAALMIGLGRTKFYELLAANEIASIKLGARRLIRVRDLEDWLSRRRGEG